MNTVQEIETAIQKLKPEEIHQVANWVQNLCDDLWDRQNNRRQSHSVMDIAPVSLGQMIRPLGPDDDLLGEMLLFTTNANDFAILGAFQCLAF
jgi:hypothetical protein